MKRFSKILALVIAFVMTALAALPTVAKADSVSAGTVKPQIVGNTGKVTLAEGDKVAVFKAPVNLSAGTVTYTSSNPKIVKITKSSAGTTFATAVSQGTATITAKSSKAGIVGGTLKVNVVKKAKTNSVQFVPNDTTLYVGQAVKTKITTTPAAASKMMTYTSSNPKVATVSSNGMIRGVAGGTATIKATAKDGSGKSSSVKITVTSIKWNEKKKSMTVGQKSDAGSYFTFVPESVESVAKYISSDSSILKVDGHTLTAVSPGKVNLTVKANDRSGLVKIYEFNVKPKKEEEEKLTSVTAENITALKAKESEQIKVTVAPAGAKADFSYEVIIGDSYVDVDPETGVVTGKSRGTATIKVTAKNGVSEVETTVTVKVVEDLTKAVFKSEFTTGDVIDVTFGEFKWIDYSDLVAKANDFIKQVYNKLGEAVTCYFIKEGKEYKVELGGEGLVITDPNGNKIDLEQFAASGSSKEAQIRVIIPANYIPRLLKYIEAAQDLGSLEYNGVIMSAVNFLGYGFKFGKVSEVTMVYRPDNTVYTYRFFVENGELYFKGDVRNTPVMEHRFNNPNSDKEIFEDLLYPIWA